MLCKKCGAELPDGTERCIFCGAVLAEEENKENPDSEENTVYDENERKRREQIDKMIAEKKQQLSEIEERRNSKKQKQKRNRIIIICLIVAVLAAGAGIGAYFIKDAIDTQRVSVTPSPSPSPSAAAAAETASPEPGETLAPAETPEVQATPVPSSSAQSWSSTGNTGSGTSSGLSSSSGSGSSGASGQKASGTGNTSSASGSTSGSGTSSSASPTAAPKNTGISAKTVDAKLAKGGQVIYNQSTGRYLMTFISENTLYYANVSEGSTTEQINEKYMTVTAAPTGETYDGNTVYEISALTSYDGSSYILSNSGTKLLTSEDIAGLSKDQLALARNEIYARHGRKFKMAVYQDYFNKCSWYSINPNYNYADDNSNLNEIERKNVAFILKAENAL